MPRKKNPRKNGKWKPKCAFDMEQLPQALVMDILSRLPIKSLCNCKYVCKEWLHMIHGPEFARLHLQRSPISILIKTSPPRREQSKLDLIHVESDGSDMRVDRMRFAPLNSIPCYLFQVDLMNSCNGLLCLTESKRDGSLYVCNPILGQYISIPCPDKNRYYSCNFTAIGFSAKTKEYKVVQTSFREYNRSEPVAHIYTIGTGVWRSLGKPPRGGRIPFDSFLHGTLHWIPYASYNYTQSIQSFDFEREEFRPLPLPPVSLKKSGQYDGFGLGVLKGCILSCVFESNQCKGRSQGTVDMWIMKDYGVQESWTKILVIENLYPDSSYIPIMFLNDVEILMRYRRSVVYYDQETKSLKRTRIVQTQSEFEAFGFCPCFVSLHDVSKGEEVKRIRDKHQAYNILLGRGSSDSACSSVPPNHKSKKLN
ncbi:hypothetical protein ACLB2K_002379 [Fragaria x ananassa]